jgi:hypothetical protein
MTDLHLSWPALRADVGRAWGPATAGSYPHIVTYVPLMKASTASLPGLDGWPQSATIEEGKFPSVPMAADIRLPGSSECAAYDKMHASCGDAAARQPCAKRPTKCATSVQGLEPMHCVVPHGRKQPQNSMQLWGCHLPGCKRLSVRIALPPVDGPKLCSLASPASTISVNSAVNHFSVVSHQACQWHQNMPQKLLQLLEVSNSAIPKQGSALQADKSHIATAARAQKDCLGDCKLHSSGRTTAPLCNAASS